MGSIRKNNHEPDTRRCRSNKIGPDESNGQKLDEGIGKDKQQNVGQRPPAKNLP